MTNLGTTFVELAGNKIFEQVIGQNKSKTIPIDQYIKEVHDMINTVRERLDEDRLAKLHGGLTMLRGAAGSNVKSQILSNSLQYFHEIASIPHTGRTGNFENAQLRCLAYLGMAAAHKGLNDPRNHIGEYIILAVEAHEDTVTQFLGYDKVKKISGISGEVKYKELIKSDPYLASNHNSLGVAFYKQSKYYEAERCFKKAIDINNKEGVYYTNLASVHIRLGRLSSAKEYAVIALNLGFKDSWVCEKLGL